MNDLLLEEIMELQRSYKSILAEAASNIFKKDTHAILDEINVFWSRNKKLVHCALQYLAKPYRTFVFTAATILDIEDMEHYPFLCFGDCHIWDDPIYSYIQMATTNPNEAFTLKIEKQIQATIKDNIEILDKLNDNIFIFPVRMVSDVDAEVVHKAAQRAFLSLFTSSFKTVAEYLDTFDTIDDVVSGLRQDIENMIVLDDGEDTSGNLRQKFNEYKSNSALPLPEDTSDAFVFAFALHGYLSQAFHVILACSEFQFVPYVRFSVAFKYLLMICGSFPDFPERDEWLFKSSISHVLHNSFDKKKYSDIEFSEFVRKIGDYNFEAEVFKSLQENNISLEKPSISETVRILDEHLDNCLLAK